ncbi:MAG: phosphatase PAP2 family protein [Ignavibacteria bacterium]|nr:phosphatase PAP2 family protein [Ignavibacteria bacterium]
MKKLFFFVSFPLMIYSQPFSLEDTATRSSVSIISKENLDIRIFRSINNSRSKFKDRLLDITDRSVLLVSLLTPLTQLAFSSYLGNYYDQNSAVLTASSQILNFTLTYTTKVIAKRKRPFRKLNNVYVRKSLTDDQYSFPSGHTSSAFANATSYLLRYPEYPQIYIPIYFYAATVAYGRNYFGMHYPSDVLAGAIYGTGSAILVYSLRKPIINLKNNITGNYSDDNKSSGARNAFYFAGAFALSVIINEFIIRENTNIMLHATPESSGLSLKINATF